MTRLMRQVAAAEAALARRDAAKPRTWHRIVQQVGQSEDEAIDAYGRDRIGPDDGIILREMVRPRRLTRCVFVSGES